MLGVRERIGERGGDRRYFAAVEVTADRAGLTRAARHGEERSNDQRGDEERLNGSIHASDYSEAVMPVIDPAG